VSLGYAPRWNMGRCLAGSYHTRWQVLRVFRLSDALGFVRRKRTEVSVPVEGTAVRTMPWLAGGGNQFLCDVVAVGGRERVPDMHLDKCENLLPAIKERLA
jgi:hypothetical protein